MRYQSEGAVASGAIRSMVVDGIGNWSTGVSEVFLIDWTAPEIDFLHDGISEDIDTTFSTTLQANWAGSDEHSAIDHYEIAIGTLPSLNNVLNWTNTSLDQAFSHVLSSPVYNQVYNISLRIVNGAGLESLFVSDGQRLVDEASLGLNNYDLSQISIYPNPASEFITIEGLTDNMIVFIYDVSGKLISQYDSISSNAISVKEWAQGVYQLVIQQGSTFIVKRVVVE
jgi:hypothetical protein